MLQQFSTFKSAREIVEQLLPKERSMQDEAMPLYDKQCCTGV